MKIVAATLLGVLLVTGAAISPTRAASSGRPCSAARILGSLSDAVTLGNDGTVLAAALAGTRELTACGDERDAISAELFSADAYGDTSQPLARCRALHDATRRLRLLHDTERARKIGAVAGACR